ncbi:MAG: hypothetical protein IJ696_01790 [Ruminococcus sp.]|nr:hypothetical protein [Ruminococcus sp.]
MKDVEKNEAMKDSELDDDVLDKVTGGISMDELSKKYPMVNTLSPEDMARRPDLSNITPIDPDAVHNKIERIIKLARNH